MARDVVADFGHQGHCQIVVRAQGPNDFSFGVIAMRVGRERNLCDAVYSGFVGSVFWADQHGGDEQGARGEQPGVISSAPVSASWSLLAPRYSV